MADNNVLQSPLESKLVWQFQHFKFSPGNLSTTMTFDFSSYGTNVDAFSYGLMGLNIVLDGYVKTLGIAPKVLNWTQGNPKIDIQVTLDATNAEGNIDQSDGNWVQLVVIAYVDSNGISDAMLTNASNIPSEESANIGNNRLAVNRTNAFSFLAGFSFAQTSNSPFTVQKPTIVSMKATPGVKTINTGSGFPDFGLSSYAMMLNADTANYGQPKTYSYPGSISAGFLAISDNFVDDKSGNNKLLVKAQVLSFTADTPVDKDGAYLPMPSFDVDSSKYKLVQATSIIQNFQIGRNADNLYEFVNGSVYLNSWVGGALEKVFFGSYFSLKNPEGKEPWNRGCADILVICLFEAI